MMMRKVEKQIKLHNLNEHIMLKQKLVKEVFLDYLRQVNISNSYHHLLLIMKGTNAKVYMRIHDQNGQISQPIELQKSTNHKNKFERGQTDEFDVGMLIENKIFNYLIESSR